MEICFETKKIGKILNSNKELNKAYPSKVAHTVAVRLAQLAAVNNLSQITHLPPLGLHKLTGDRKNRFAVWTKEKYRIVFYLLDDEYSIITDPDYPRDEITKIRIIEVVNYHV